MTAETKPMPAYGSSTVVSTCMATNATASSDTLRCSPDRTTRGIAPGLQPRGPGDAERDRGGQQDERDHAGRPGGVPQRARPEPPAASTWLAVERDRSMRRTSASRSRSARAHHRRRGTGVCDGCCGGLASECVVVTAACRCPRTGAGAGPGRTRERYPSQRSRRASRARARWRRSVRLRSGRVARQRMRERGAEAQGRSGSAAANPQGQLPDPGQPVIAPR